MTAKKYLRIIKRDDLLSGEPPNLTPAERRKPVKIVLIRPLEVNGEIRDSLILKPPTRLQVLRYGGWKGTTDEKILRLISHVSGISIEVLGTMLPSDFNKVIAILSEFADNY